MGLTVPYLLNTLNHLSNDSGLRSIYYETEL